MCLLTLTYVPVSLGPTVLVASQLDSSTTQLHTQLHTQLCSLRENHLDERSTPRIAMPIILRSLCLSSCAVSPFLVSVTRVPSQINIASRIAPKQGSNLFYPEPINVRTRCQQLRLSSNDQKAKELNQQGIDNEMSKFDHDLAAEKEKQARTPWHREGADQPPVARAPSASATTKGRIRAYHTRHGLTVNRQASDHPIQAAQASSTIDHAQSQLGRGRHRPACSTYTPSATSLLPGASHTGRASEHYHRQGRKQNT